MDMQSTLSRSTVTLVTPSFAGDLERFVFQRESIERCAIDLPHVAIVDTEDLRLFQAIPFQRNLTIVPTSDVLPPSFERRRQVWGISRRDYRYWITGKGVHGWMIQQLLKLAAPTVIETDAFVCLDSDTFFVDRVTADDFVSEDGRLHLYETSNDVDAEMAEWHAHALRFFGVKETGIAVRRYTHSPVPMHRGVVLDMQRFIEARHRKSWMDIMVAGDRLMEYTLYGTFARHVDGLRRVANVVPPLSTYFWWPNEVASIEGDFFEKVQATGSRIIGIQSNTACSVSRIRSLAQSVWPKCRAAVVAHA